MSYQIVAISNEKRAPEQAYNKLERAAACPDANFSGMYFSIFRFVRHFFKKTLTKEMLRDEDCYGSLH